MDGGSSLVNIGELSKPATVLIEKISGAVGGIFKPYQIVRVAKAEAEADKIRAEAQIEITDLQRRALHRFLNGEARNQSNMESITQQALPLLEENAEPDKIEDDWITNFFDKCRLISDSDMQALWSRVLAGEANVPGSFSKRTVNFLSSLDKSDAELFTGLCTFCWHIGVLTPVVLNVRHSIYAKHGVNVSALRHLDSIGLVSYNAAAVYGKTQVPEEMSVAYYGQVTALDFRGKPRDYISVGGVFLTKIGQELAPICGSKPDPEFREYVLGLWREEGCLKEPAEQES